MDQLDVKVQKIKDEKVSSMITVSEESRRMQDMMKMYGMAGMDPSMFGTTGTLVLNANHPLVQYVQAHKDERIQVSSVSSYMTWLCWRISRYHRKR